MAELLLADDELSARRSFTALFAASGHAVRAVRSGREAVREFLIQRPDLVLLDVMMPGMDGLSACAEIRQLDAVIPILFLTAFPSENALVRGLGLGGDDYLEKSAPPASVLAHVEAALRRKRAYETAVGERLCLGAVEVDLGAMTLVFADGAREALTRTETLLLSALARVRGQFLNREALLVALGYEKGATSALRVRGHIANLRRKLGSAREVLESCPGVGYRLRP